MPWRIAAVLLALLLPSSPAAAARMPFRGEVSVDFLGSSLPPLLLTGTGVATLNGSGGGAHLSSARFAGGLSDVTTLPVTDPDVTMTGQIRALQASVALGTATLGLGATPFGAPILTRPTLPVAGLARLCFFDTHCGSGPLLPLGHSAATAGIGVGGLLTAGGTGALRFSVVGEPWTVGTTWVTVTTNAGSTFAVASAGWIHGPASFSTSTALTGGALSAVTPIRVHSNQGASLLGFGRLRVRFVPEPGSLTLWSSGALGLGWLARARLRRAARLGREGRRS